MELRFSRLQILPRSSVPSPKILETDILSLPPEVRSKIWVKVSVGSQRSLRQVCRTFRHDIDVTVGVHGILTGTPLNLKWIPSVNIISLRADFQNPAMTFEPQASLWKNPYLLQSLAIVQGTVPYITAITLLQSFTNLRELNLALLERTQAQDTRIISQNLLTCQDLPRILAALHFNPKLEKLEIRLSSDPELFQPHFQDVEVIEQNTNATIRLKHLLLHCPELPEKYRLKLKGLMDVQDELETFSTDLSLTHWTLYRAVIRNSRKTLTKVELHDLRCADVVFDWTLFDGCSNLIILKITGNEIGARPLNSANLEAFPFINLTHLELTNVKLPPVMFHHLIICTTVRLKILELQFFQCRANSVYIQLDWTLYYAKFDRIRICEKRSFFESQICSDVILRMNSLKKNFSYDWAVPRKGYGYIQLERGTDEQLEI